MTATARQLPLPLTAGRPKATRRPRSRWGALVSDAVVDQMAIDIMRAMEGLRAAEAELGESEREFAEAEREVRRLRDLVASEADEAPLFVDLDEQVRLAGEYPADDDAVTP